MKQDTKKVVYLVRHGQSIDNASPVFQAEDSPLSPKGKKQAQEVADRLSKIEFDVLISSSFNRAQETASYIARATQKQPIISDLFVERRKPMSINGKPWDDEEATETWREWDKSLSTPGVRVQDGENYDDLIKRADEALAYLSNREEKKIVVVSHGYFLRCLTLRVLLGDSVSPEATKNFQMAAQIENTGLIVIKYEDGFEQDFNWRLWTYNDLAHFAE